MRVANSSWVIDNSSMLEGRRTRSDLIENFKIVNGKYDINPKLFFQLDEDGRRGHDWKLFKNGFKLNVKKCFFFQY